MKFAEIIYNQGTQVHCYGDPSLPQDTEYLIQLFKPFKGKQRCVGFCSLTKFRYFGFYKSFVENLSMEIHYFDKEKGLVLLQEKTPVSFTDSEVLIKLDSEDYFEATTWLDSVVRFKNKNNPLRVHVASNFSSRFQNIYSTKPSFNNLNFIDFEKLVNFKHLFEITKRDPYKCGVERYGPYFAKQYTYQLTDQNWNMYKSFDFPRDWNYISTEQFSNDILGLESMNDSEYRGKFTDYNYYHNIDQSTLIK